MSECQRERVEMTDRGSLSELANDVGCGSEREFGAVSGEEFGGGVDECFADIDGESGFAESAGDEFEFSGVGADVAGREDARSAGLHELIDGDLVFVEVESPFFDRAEVGDETEVADDGVDFEGGFGFGPVIKDDGASDLMVTFDGFDFVEEHDACGGLHHFFDAVFVSAEFIAAVDEGLLGGDASEHVGPIDGGVSPAEDEDAFTGEVVDAFDEVGETTTEPLICVVDGYGSGREGTDAGRDEDDAGFVFAA